MKDGIRTAGVILREGVTKGLNPSISVLEVGRKQGKRANEDMLPYLDRYRHRFTPLPQTDAEMKLCLQLVPFSDIECLTGSICQEVDVTGVQSKDEEAMNKAKDQLLRACSSWTSSTWQEIDYSRIKDMNIRQIIENRGKAATDAQAGEGCIVCPELPKHVSSSSTLNDSNHKLTVYSSP